MERRRVSDGDVLRSALGRGDKTGKTQTPAETAGCTQAGSSKTRNTPNGIPRGLNSSKNGYGDCGGITNNGRGFSIPKCSVGPKSECFTIPSHSVCQRWSCAFSGRF